MSNIANEIEQLAEDMAKSSRTPEEALFDTIRELGPEGVRAKLPTLEKSEQELLLSALEEMKKGGKGSGVKGHKTAAHLATDNDHLSDYRMKHAHLTREQHSDKAKELRSADGSPRYKENMATLASYHESEASAGMKKAVEMDKDYAAKFVQGKITDTIIQEDKADDDQDEKLVKPEAAKMNHQGTPTEGWEGQVIKGKEPMKKDEVKQIADKEAKQEIGEHEDKMHQMKKKMKEMKKALELEMPEASPELIKSEMKKRLLAEESQNGDAPEMNEGTRAKKESAPEIELGKDNKKNMTKSTPWTSENDLLKAMTGGRNHHFSMEDYINQVLAEANGKIEEVKKSESTTEDLNDIIEKGGDRRMSHFETEKLMKDNEKKKNGKVVKSFADNEIAQALGLSEEEAKKILGE